MKSPTLRVAAVLIGSAVAVVPFHAIDTGSAHAVLFLDKKPTDAAYAGRWLMTTVSSGRASLATAVLSILAPHYTVTDVGAQLRDDSWRQAYSDASRVIAGKVDTHPSAENATLLQVLDPVGAAATANLHGGDEVLSVDGQAPTSAIPLIARERAHLPLSLNVQQQGRLGQTRAILLPREHPRTAPYGLWFVKSAKADPTFAPADTSFGGSSAGLMLLLAGLDARTVGDLSGNKLIAGTGALDGTGAVLEIAGAVPKVIAARKAHAAVFFIPRANYTSALVRAAGGSMLVVPVLSEGNAISWLCSHGGHAEGVCTAL